MDIQADKNIKIAAEKFRRTKEQKFSNHILEDIYQSIIPINKLLK
jgi:hypothetical protein